MTLRRALLVAAVATSVVLTLPACAGLNDPSDVDSLVAEGPSSSSASPTTPTTDAATVSVPLVHSPSGGLRLYTTISVGGGAPFLVMLDTGSTGLFVEPGVVGPEVTKTSTPFKVGYVSDSLETDLATGSFSIGGVQTTQDITFGIVTTKQTEAIYGTEAQGIMGVAPVAAETASAGLLSPFVQLPAPYDQGFQVDISATDSGTLQIGRPTPSAQTVTTPLSTVPSPASMSGTTFYNKDVTLCWTVGSNAANCGPTDLDTGAPKGMFDTSVAGDLTVDSGIVAPGQTLAVSTPAGAPLWTVTTGGTDAQNKFDVNSLANGTLYNTGLGFYYAQVVGFDWVAGELQLTPQ